MWVSPHDVIDFNYAAVTETMEPFHLRDYGLLESACARPRQLWAYGETDLTTLAAALLFGICRNHPFTQGNKRTGFIAFVDFLELNGHMFIAPDTETLAQSIIDVLERKGPEDVWVDIARHAVVPV